MADTQEQGGDASKTALEGGASLIRYPCAFPIKVMGEKSPGFVEAMVGTARLFDPGFDAQTVEVRHSSQGRYQGLTLTVMATSPAQLDGLYRAFSTHPLVRVVL